MTGALTAPMRRAVEPADEPILRALVLDARPELGLLPPAAREQMADLQLRAQRRQFAADHPEFCEELAFVDGAPVARIVVAPTEHVVRVLDVVVSSAHRRRGHGAALLRDVIAEAGRRDVRLSVRVDNVVARRLYESLGFGVADRSSQPDRLELAHVSTEACG